MTNTQHQLDHEAKRHTADENHGAHFSNDNTGGSYSSADLAVMNAAADAQLKAAGIESADDWTVSGDHASYRRVCADVLRGMEKEAI